MQFNRSSREKSDQILWNFSDDDDQQVSDIARSYSCTFCGRGFSNAQALGGHMNIHRKDRARLRHQSFSTDRDDQSLLSMDITKKTPATTDDHLQTSADDDQDSSRLQSREEKIGNSKRPRVNLCKELGDDFSRGRDGVGALKQLYLFVETAPSSRNDLAGDSSQVCEFVGKHNELSHGSSQTEVTELDLELRLGFEHHHASASGNGEFF